MKLCVAEKGKVELIRFSRSLSVCNWDSSGLWNSDLARGLCQRIRAAGGPNPEASSVEFISLDRRRVGGSAAGGTGGAGELFTTGALLYTSGE